MKRLFIIIAAIWTVAGLNAATLVERADSAYSADNFTEARALYLEAVKTDGTSADLLYNLGNACYRVGNPGEAVLYYERALRLDPTMADARENLNFVNSRIVDQPGERGTFVGNALDSAANASGSNGWAWVAFGCFVLTAAGACLYMFAGSVLWRKVGFFGAGVTALLCLGAFFFSYRAAGIATADDRAVVMKNSTILSTVPRAPKDRSEEAMLLHEGTTVKILDRITAPGDSAGVWYDAEVDNSHRAWISAADVEII